MSTATPLSCTAVNCHWPSMTGITSSYHISWLVSRLFTRNDTTQMYAVNSVIIHLTNITRARRSLPQRGEWTDIMTAYGESKASQVSVVTKDISLFKLNARNARHRSRHQRSQCFRICRKTRNQRHELIAQRPPIVRDTGEVKAHIYQGISPYVFQWYLCTERRLG
jgi:hypothetical protein